MKNTKLFQILTLVLSLAVLTVGLCFVASAADEPSVSIIAKNVSYDDVVKVMFAVDNTKAGENEIELLYYLEDPTVNPSAEAYKGAAYDKGYTDDNGDTYPAFFSAGFPAKRLGDKVYARAHIVGTEIYSEVVRYSVVEYLLERLYVDMATGDKKALYEDLLSYGASAQKVLINGNSDPADNIKDGEFITDYVLVGIENGTLDGKYDQGIYFVDDKVYPQADGIATWNATVFDLTTGVGTTTEVNGGAAYNVTGFTMFTAKAQGEAPAPAYKPDLTDTAGRINWSDNTVAGYQNSGAIDYNIDGSITIVKDAPYGTESDVLRFEANPGDGQYQLFIKKSPVSGANCAAYETDMKLDVTSSTTIEFQIRAGSAKVYVPLLSAGVDGDITFDGVVVGKVGEWFRLRVEYVKLDSGDVVGKVYANEVLLATTAPIANASSPDTVTRLIMAAYTTADFEMYLDNTKLEFVTVEEDKDETEEPEASYKPDLTDTAGRETYEDGDAFDTFKFDNGATTEIVNDAPYGEASKVYKYIKDNNTGTNEINIKPASKPSGTNTFFFESDVKFVASGAATIEIQIRGNSSVGTGYTLYLSATGDGDVVIKNNSNVAIATIAKTGEWFRLGIGYGTTAEGSGVLVYVNGEQINESPLAASKNVADFDRIRFMGHQASVFEFYLDNTKAQYFVK